MLTHWRLSPSIPLHTLTHTCPCGHSGRPLVITPRSPTSDMVAASIGQCTTMCTEKGPDSLSKVAAYPTSEEAGGATDWGCFRKTKQSTQDVGHAARQAAWDEVQAYPREQAASIRALPSLEVWLKGTAVRNSNQTLIVPDWCKWNHQSLWTRAGWFLCMHVLLRRRHHQHFISESRQLMYHMPEI